MRLDVLDPRRWPLWQTPGRVLGAVLTVELAAVLLVGRLLVFGGLPDGSVLALAATIVGLGLGQAEIVAGVERVRRRIGPGSSSITAGTVAARASRASRPWWPTHLRCGTG